MLMFSIAIVTIWYWCLW